MPALAHFGIGLAIKKFSPKVPLWILLISSMLIDLLSFVFILEPLWISHGLFMSIVWTLIAMLIPFILVLFLSNDTEKILNRKIWNMKVSHISIIIGAVTFSHWILDFIGWPMSVINPEATGTPLLFDDIITIGLGVYSTWFGALFMDLGVFTIGLILYIQYVIKNKKIKD